MSIEVQEPGLLTTVQDLGREGFGPMGVSPSGAADAVSLRLGNGLAGNNENAAALEMTLVGGAFRFVHDAAIALTGSDFDATLNETPLSLWESHPVHAGAVLRLGATRSGVRCYLCVHGGIAVEPFLGSASTHLLSGLGGFEGRSLRRGDVLNIGAASEPFRKRRVDAAILQALAPRKLLRVTPGPQANWFPESSQHAFYASTYRVAENSNRMGLRLEGAAITLLPPRELLTEGAPLGAIQIPPSGLAHHPLRRAANHRRLSQDRQRHLCRSALRRPASPARRNPLPARRIRDGAIPAPRAGAAGPVRRDYGMKFIDLNCDMGEIPEHVNGGLQESLMPYPHFRQRSLRRPRRR